MKISHVADVELLREVYDSLLVESFPPEELVSAEYLIRGSAAGSIDVVTCMDSDSLVAAAVAENFAESGVVLLSWLAVSEQSRSAGFGTKVLGHALERWQSRFQPRLILAEIEHPGIGTAEVSAYGDRAARVRFYERAGAMALDLPYFQPALRPSGRRVFGMVLVVLRVDGQMPTTQSIEGGRLAAWFDSYCDPLIGEDGARSALEAAMSSPVLIRDLGEVYEIPRSVPGNVS